MRKRRPSKTITIRLGEKDIELLKKVAEENKITVSDLMKHALRSYGLQIRPDDVRELGERVNAAVRVQQKIIGDIHKLEESIEAISQYYEHIVWNPEEEKPVVIEGKNVKAFPLYWVRASSRR